MPQANECTEYTSTRQNHPVDTRDASARRHTAPAWDGSLDQLDANQLSDRIDALAAHIGCITTRFDSLAEPGHQFEVVVNLDEIRRWATARAACLNELERRATEAGDVPINLVFASPSWKAKFEARP